jgi:Cell division protein FtsQ
MRRALFVGAVAIVLVISAYLFLGRGSSVTPHLVASGPVAVIESESGALGVAANGEVLAGIPLSEESGLPKLSLETPPKGGRVKGPALEQVKVLAATPAALFPYVEGTYFGESGVDVELTSGVELRFGNAAGASRKWRAAAAVLADPSVTTLDYVDLHAPGHPSVGGSGHTLPPPP